MKRARHPALAAWRRNWKRIERPVRRLALAAMTALPIFAVWPYATLWQLDQALAAQDRETLSKLVDLEAVRDALGNRLNKEHPSDIGGLSDAFIDWLESGLRQTGSEQFLDRWVTLDWIAERLSSKRHGDQGIRDALTYAFFEDPIDFRVRLGPRNADPLILRLRFQGLGWRIVMLYY
ncbi:DUF2939 domain-containing protein [Imhoffiella purpurea]|uniref:DUF2939 domain-containing protein n=1 Tax=Imhoffiella purpurea TaxID=1249627 RepID=W9W3T3_9GAMM|nr:DUF2939 domain-containing protein [Imhoffiella purpurea]EXJ17220.1 hypothetical protein D779_0047 [Imhoffiella purpurea]